MAQTASAPQFRNGLGKIVVHKEKYPEFDYIFTDGSCEFMDTEYAIAGIGVFYGINDKRNISENVNVKRPTNNIAEFTAIIKAIKSV